MSEPLTTEERTRLRAFLADFRVAKRNNSLAGRIERLLDEVDDLRTRSAAAEARAESAERDLAVAREVLRAVVQADDAAGTDLGEAGGSPPCPSLLSRPQRPVMNPVRLRE